MSIFENNKFLRACLPVSNKMSVNLACWWSDGRAFLNAYNQMVS